LVRRLVPLHSVPDRGFRLTRFSSPAISPPEWKIRDIPMPAAKAFLCLLTFGLLTGCQGPGYERIPATAVDNPDPLLSSRIPKADMSGPPPAEMAAAGPKTDMPVTTTSQPRTTENRIGPLTFRPTTSAQQPPQPADVFSPGAASLAVGAREPKPALPADQNVRPASTFAPVSDPEIVKGYRQRLLALNATPPKTRPLDSGAWEAVAYFEDPRRPGELRRISAEGVSEADALLAILEQVERNK